MRLIGCAIAFRKAETVVPFVTRLVKKPFRAGGDDYPPGVHLCPCIHLVHRDPDLYPVAGNFRPERFLERKFGPHEWLPFGGGDRLCTGMAFAMTQMKTVLATLVAGPELRRLERTILLVRGNAGQDWQGAWRAGSALGEAKALALALAKIAAA